MNAMVYGGLALALAASALNVVAATGMFLFASLFVTLVLSLVATVGCVVALGGVALSHKPAPLPPEVA